MPDTNHSNDITPQDGALIVKEANTWKGTKYSKAGKGSVKNKAGDCSGSTFWIYTEAGFPYEYKRSAEFPDYAIKSGLFRKLGKDEGMQEGDILSWKGHMAIYSSFNHSGSGFNMWTAHREGGDPYGPANYHKWQLGNPTVFRYKKQ